MEELAAALRDAEEELRRARNETKEALERQTATADILQVIASSPSDVQPVFDAIVQSGLPVFSGAGVAVVIVDGDRLHVVAAGGIANSLAAKKIVMPRNRESAAGTAIVDRIVVVSLKAQD